MKILRLLTLPILLCAGGYILYQYITAAAEVKRAIDIYLHFLHRYGIGLGVGILCLLVFTLLKRRKNGTPHHKSPAPRTAKPSAATPPAASTHSILLPDTNILMNESALATLIRMARSAPKQNWSIHIESIVVGELKGLSKNPDKSEAARRGMRGIEKLQQLLNNRLIIQDSAIRGEDTIADTVLLRVAAAHRNMILITDDTELRILARGKKVKVVGSANL